MKYFFTVAIGLAFVSLASVTAHQGRAPYSCNEEYSSQRNEAPPRKHKENWKQLQSAKIAFFTTSMGLTPEEAEIFWPVYNKFHKEEREAHKKTRESLSKIKELSTKENYPEIDMKRLLIEYLDNFAKEGELNKLYLSEFLNILPVAKVAKMYVAEEEFRFKIIKMWKKPDKEPGDNR